jgi:hypothetical protein
MEIMNKGFIKISDILYREEWDKFYIFMKDFRPTHIEFRHWENDIWYMYGVSAKFKPVKEGEDVPQYDVLFTTHKDGSLTYEFKSA